MAAPTTPSECLDIDHLVAELTSGSEKQQLQVIPQFIAFGEQGIKILQDFLLDRKQQATPVTFIDGRAYELLRQIDAEAPQAFLLEQFPTGVVPLRSDLGIDYLPLQNLLAEQSFEHADRVTLQKLCELAGPAAVKRKWPYFSEVDQFPITDLQTINHLWLVHSEGKFGYSVQRQLWLSVGRNWDTLWPKINWRSQRNWTRYPDGFTWDLSAPKGHLPLSNQLRGVQTMNALLNHPAWSS